MTTITKKDFLNYVDLQKEGCINMFDIKGVIDITGLNRDKVLIIMKKYSQFDDKWGVKR